MKFAIIGNPGSGNYKEVYGMLMNTLNEYGDTVIHCPDPETCTHGIDSPDAIISVGGDGTFLQTAAKYGKSGIPMLGVNAGRLGFLADISEKNLADAFRDIHEGRYTIGHRPLLKLSLQSPSGHDCIQGSEYGQGSAKSFLPKDFTPYAVNDIAILKHDISSMISINTYVDGTFLTRYMADGLVIATPTGSTAYSLSVGGPVIAPGTDVISLTPVAPHSLTMRPLVMQGNSTIEVTVESRTHNFLVSIDGRSFSCPEGIHLKIEEAPFRFNVMRPACCNFFSTLRHKMMWGADSRL